MTRTLLAGELAQAQDWNSDYYVKLEVQNASGTWIDVGAALGKLWIINATWGEQVDTAVSQATFTLIQQIGSASFSPLMSASPLNVDDFAAYAPLFNVGRLVRASSATMAHNVALDVAKYRKFFDGRIDNVGQSDSGGGWAGPITLRCSDLGAWLMDMQIETSGIQYGTTPVGTAIETVLQNVLTANIPASEPAVSLYKQSPSTFAVTDWKQGDTKVMEALSTLVLDSTGEDIRYRYDASHLSRLTWYNPDRTRVTVDATFSPRQYVLRQLDLALANIRNAGEMPYQGGVAVATSPSSILAFRRRFFRLPSSAMITTLVDAQKVIDAVVNDLSAPPGEAAADIPFFWPVQLYDRYTFQANARQYDTDQTFAVMGYQHTIENARGSTTLTLTARIVGAFSAWLTRLGAVADPDASSLRDVTWTETATQEVVKFGRGAAVLEVWAAYAIVTAPVQATDFDARVAPFVGVLPDGATTFATPRPTDGFVVLVQLEPRRSDLSAGPIRRLTITGAPQLPDETFDDVSSPTTGTQFMGVTERGIAVTQVLARYTVGTNPTTGWVAPTRVAGGVSLVKGGVLTTGQYEHDAPRDATGSMYIEFLERFANGTERTRGPFQFDPDTLPRLVSWATVGTVVTIIADDDTRSVALESLTRPWKYRADGRFAEVDVSKPGTDGSAGLGAATSDTFRVKAYAAPVAEVTPTTLVDFRDILVGTAGYTPPAAVWDSLVVTAPGVGASIMDIALKATAAPGGWTAKVFVKDPETAALTDVTASLSPALSAPPTVLTHYNYGAQSSRVNNGPRSTAVKVAVYAYLYDNLGALQSSKYAEVSYYTPMVI